MSIRDWLGKLWPFGKRQNTEGDSDNDRATEHGRAKQAALEHVLGPMENVVGHAIIPFQIGGAVDMYYFSQTMPGTVFATMELIMPDGSGPQPNRLGTYELVACTCHPRPQIDLELDAAKATELEDETDFGRIERRICGIFTTIGSYSFQAVLQPGETAEIPGEDGKETKCLLFDEFDTHGVPFEIEGKRHGLLLCMEIHRSEMEHAMKNGSADLLTKLKAAGHYPYSDMGRAPVV